MLKGANNLEGNAARESKITVLANDFFAAGKDPDWVINMDNPPSRLGEKA